MRIVRFGAQKFHPADALFSAKKAKPGGLETSRIRTVTLTYCNEVARFPPN
jgi:hypothetical protein